MAESYENSYEYIFHIIINSIVMIIFINIINRTHTNFGQLIIISLLIFYLLSWLMWMMDHVGMFNKKRKNKK